MNVRDRRVIFIGSALLCISLLLTIIGDRLPDAPQPKPDPIMQAGRAAGYAWRATGNQMPSGSELDAMAFLAVGPEQSQLRYVWESGFKVGWIEAY